MASHLALDCLRAMDKMRQKAEMCDLKLTAEGIEFPAHKVVLAAFSANFYQIFSLEKTCVCLSRVKLHGTSASIVGLVLDFLYTGSITFNMDIVIHLLKFASSWKIPSLESYCYEFLHQQLTPENCLSLMQIINNALQNHENYDNVNPVEGYCYENFGSVSKTTEFLQLNVEMLISYINKGDFMNTNPDSVNSALMRWVKFDADNREPIFLDLVKQLHLGSLNKNESSRQRRPVGGNGSQGGMMNNLLDEEVLRMEVEEIETQRESRHTIFTGNDEMSGINNDCDMPSMSNQSGDRMQISNRGFTIFGEEEERTKNDNAKATDCCVWYVDGNSLQIKQESTVESHVQEVNATVHESEVVANDAEDDEPKKIYSCLQCGKEYSSRNNLKRHKLTHLGMKPYRCNICKRTFQRRDYAIWHQQKYHNFFGRDISIVSVLQVPKFPLNRSEASQSVKASSTGESPAAPSMSSRKGRGVGGSKQASNAPKAFQCPQCGKQFVSSRTLKRHKLTHTGLKPFKCNICGRSFLRKDYAIWHQQKFHEHFGRDITVLPTDLNSVSTSGTITNKRRADFGFKRYKVKKEPVDNAESATEEKETNFNLNIQEPCQNEGQPEMPIYNDQHYYVAQEFDIHQGSSNEAPSSVPVYATAMEPQHNPAVEDQPLEINHPPIKPIKFSILPRRSRRKNCDVKRPRKIQVEIENESPVVEQFEESTPSQLESVAYFDQTAMSNVVLNLSKHNNMVSGDEQNSCDYPGSYVLPSSSTPVMAYEKSNAKSDVKTPMVDESELDESNLVIDMPSVRYVSVNAKFSCDQCQKTFKSSRTLKRHKLNQHGLVRFRCNICHHIFRRKDYVVWHQRECHKHFDRDISEITVDSSDKKHPSPSGDENEKVNSNLNNHTQAEDSGISLNLVKKQRRGKGKEGEKDFFQEKFGEKLGLKRKSHSPSKSESVCDDVESEGKRPPIRLKLNLKAAGLCQSAEDVDYIESEDSLPRNGDTEGKHGCSMCNKEFTLKKNLKRHELIHLGIKPFNCEICWKTFTRNEDKLNHKRKVHECYDVETEGLTNLHEEYSENCATNLESSGLQSNSECDLKDNMQYFAKLVGEPLNAKDLSVNHDKASDDSEPDMCVQVVADEGFAGSDPETLNHLQECANQNELSESCKSETNAMNSNVEAVENIIGATDKTNVELQHYDDVSKRTCTITENVIS
ncbi:uncharacterized protein LOC102800530 [Saccoglossus kowalevskii]|uniref:Zinc finger protein 236-like n=1 Tax=Saccoglossus kowalevskii TaxID=10224 RepID=A0ABM0MVY0_SACKO|nr:PREDICTED: zinc finger protein 236-like [Saccoglossus kowalevskii]